VKLRNQQGIVLAAMVMLMVVAAITVLGVSIFVIQRLEQTEVRLTRTAAINLAEAGINRALYDYRFRDLSGNGYVTLGQTNLTAQRFFVLGADAADLIMVNTAGAFFINAGVNYFLEGLTLQNATNSKAITIDRMIVTWDNSADLRRIVINGSTVWSGNDASPVDADIPNVTLNTVPSTVNIDNLRFQGNMTGSNINIVFVMTDGTQRSVDVFPASNQFDFWLSATGKTSVSNIWRTVRARYNAITGAVDNYAEISTQITP